MNNLTPRPPVVAIMGHVDHGKTSLLDTIKKTNVVAGESGGITQHVSAYEVVHPGADGQDHKITFIDTPGHAAFRGIRERSADIADIAILIIAADDGVKAQTLEALETIQKNNVPFLIAINKIDKPAADVERVKRELAEHGVFLEGFGGTISYVPISAATGKGIDDLLETILLLAEMSEFTADTNALATGFVIESKLDQQRGMSATLLIKNGTLEKGQYVVTGNSMTATRILEDFMGRPIESATVSAPIRVVGFSRECPVGAPFQVFSTKKDAENAIEHCQDFCLVDDFVARADQEINVIPVIVKCDVVGSIDAVVSEIQKHNSDSIHFKIIKTAIGAINDSDVQLASSSDDSIIIGFHVVDESRSEETVGKSVIIKTYTIIYKMSEWLETVAEDKKFKKKVDIEHGVLKILKVFSSDKGVYLVGGSVQSGMLSVKDHIKMVVDGERRATGTVQSIQVGKSPSQKVQSGDECGIMVELNNPPIEGGLIVSYTTEIV